MALPTLDELEVVFRSGAAIPVIVEGEGRADDAWIYGDIWFGDRATEISFFPQDGWSSVHTAVVELRRRLPGVPIFGLIDRDFVPDAELDALVPDGVFRSRLYSVENYLLDPHCWHATLAVVSRPRGGLKTGWTTPAELVDRIQESYQRCLPATAFNQVVSFTARAHPGYPEAPKYIRSLQDQRLTSASNLLHKWETLCGHAQDLSAEYVQAKTDLGHNPELLPTRVDGKIVLHELIEMYKSSHKFGGFGYIDYINQYLDKCPSPPQEAVELVSRIVAAA